MTKRNDVVLVSMPFAHASRPSIGLSLLRGVLEGVGYSCRIDYLNLDFVADHDRAAYRWIADEDPVGSGLVGEWVFSGEVFGSEARGPCYLTEVFDRPRSTESRLELDPPALKAALLQMRAAAPGFLERAATRVLADAPRIVGLTSTFQQHLPSIALAKALKAAAPDTYVVMGGANCEGVMGAETLRQFPWIDAVVSGEGENALPRLVDGVFSGSNGFDSIPGVYVQADLEALFAEQEFPNAEGVHAMDALPVPSYADFMEQHAAAGLIDDKPPDVLFETARGCWWGQKHHCTFCGLNGLGMSFRSKSEERALEELDTLTRSYPGSMVQVVDNILDMSYFRHFLPALAARGGDVTLAYETKANLSFDQLRLMRDAGIIAIQPGIESLADDVLRRMRKGVTGLQNIRLLKWCRQLEVFPAWNLLWGFPGEDPADYARMAEWIPLLTHLQPPMTAREIRMDRFSPNFDDADALGLVDIRPHDAYRATYAVPEAALANLAYYFEFGYAEPQPVDVYTAPVTAAVERWIADHDQSELLYDDREGGLLVWDFRAGRPQRRIELTGLERSVLLACDPIRSVDQLVRELLEREGVRISGEALESDVLQPLEAQGLLLADGRRYLSLPVRLGPYVPATERVLDIFEMAASTA